MKPYTLQAIGTRRGLCWVNVAPCAPRVLIPRGGVD